MSVGRDIATGIVRALRAAGREACFAGGCVRDELLGLHPEDYDVATDATPDQVREIGVKERWSVNEVGASFGVLLVTPRNQPAEAHTVEVATFREEGAYTDKRRPDSVKFSTAQADARRRDFTINALFLDPMGGAEPGAAASPLGGRVIDYVGGTADLKAKVIRAVGDADARLSEDHLRALRGVRFAARLGFEIENATLEAIRRHARELAGVSRERIGDELRRMLSHASRGRACDLLQSLGLDGPALDEPCRASPAPIVGSLAPGASFATALSAWAIDRVRSGGAGGAGGAPPIEWGAIDRESAPLVSRWRKALCLSNEETDALRDTLQGVVVLDREWAALGVARRKRSASSPWFGPALEILRAGSARQAEAIGRDVAGLAATPGGLAPPALVTGDDLVAAGLRPGPAFKRWLEQVYDAQLEGRLGDREAALAFARGLASG